MTADELASKPGRLRQAVCVSIGEEEQAVQRGERCGQMPITRDPAQEDQNDDRPHQHDGDRPERDRGRHLLDVLRQQGEHWVEGEEERMQNPRRFAAGPRAVPPCILSPTVSRHDGTPSAHQQRMRIQCNGLTPANCMPPPRQRQCDGL